MHVALLSMGLIIAAKLLAFFFVGGWMSFLIFSLAYAMRAWPGASASGRAP